ncbi:MAG: glycosyltransferase [Gaiellales bacterium]
MPALNEEGAIASVVEAVLALGVVDGVVVVDGGSSDATAERARAAGARVVVECRRGYGRACLTGAQHADSAEVVLFVDGDGSDVVALAGTLIEPVLAGTVDLVLGSRIRGRRERGSMAPHQLAGNVLVAAILRRRHGVQVTDVGPFRAVSGRLLGRLDMREMSYGWPTEMIVRVAAIGGRIVEVPVNYRARVGGRSKVSGSVRGSVMAGWRMVRVAWAKTPVRPAGQAISEEV